MTAKITIPDHTTTVDEDRGTWACACHVTGADRDDPWEAAAAHKAAAGGPLLARMDDEQLRRALQGSVANETRARAAVDLLTHHGYWLGNGHFRKCLRPDWKQGTLLVYVDWTAVRHGLDQAGRSIRALVDADAADPRLSPPMQARAQQLTGQLRQWLADRDEEMWDNASAYDGQPLLKASTSEVAYLRWAASIASDGWVYLSDDTYNLGNAGRGLFLTALGHLLTDGGTIATRVAANWYEYDRAQHPADSLSPLLVLMELFPLHGPHSDELTIVGGSVLAELARWLNYATSPQGGITYPATVYDVIGSVQRAVALLDQTLNQSGERLAELASAPDATLAPPLGDSRWPDHPTPPVTAEAAALELRQARAALAAAERALSRAHVYAGRLGLDTSDDEGEAAG